MPSAHSAEMRTNEFKDAQFGYWHIVLRPHETSDTRCNELIVITQRMLTDIELLSMLLSLSERCVLAALTCVLSLKQAKSLFNRIQQEC